MTRWMASLLLLLLWTGCKDDEAEVPPAAGCSVGFGEASGQVAYDGAGSDGCHWQVTAGADDQTALQTVFIEAKPGEAICLAAGTYKLSRELQLDTDHLTIRGAGKNETVLDFAGQIQGANGIHITADNVTMEALKVLDTAGDGIRATAVSNVSFVEVAVIWTKDESQENGAYGLYPVQCDGVRVERCEVKGSRDAGIYVGQSRNILVKDNEAWGNVAGIEIENSFDAEVVGNHAHDNTGGILVFNLPNLPQVNGERTVMHNNLIENNNVVNFGLPGTIVGQVPTGSGVIIMSADKTEVHSNTIKNNKSFGVVLLAYDETIFGAHDDEEFDRFIEGCWVHDNTYENNGKEPQGIATLIHGDPVANPPLADINYGGCTDPDKAGQEGVTNCLLADDGASFLNFDLCGGFQNKDESIAPHDCSYAPLPAIEPCATMGCGTVPVAPPEKPVDETIGCASPFPQLSDYGFFEGDLAAHVPAPGVLPYEVAAKLWSDNSLKKRFIVVPDGKTATYTSEGLIDFPLGTTLIKTFYYPDGDGERLIETRLLIHEDSGWTGHTYLWNDEQTEATRYVAGKEIAVDSLTYVMPSTLLCGSCHSRNDKLEPLGPLDRQLSLTVTRGGAEVEQLQWLFEQGALDSAPQGVTPHPQPFGDGDLDARARAYLEANCAHCHREGGIASGTGLRYNAQETDPTALGICKPPVAAGAGAGKLKYDIVPGDPDKSIVIFRMMSADPGIKMPELPSLIPDDKGVALISEWIAAMDPDDCVKLPE